MKQKIVFTLTWTLAFPAAYMLLSMMMFSVIGGTGILGAPSQSGILTSSEWHVAIFGMIWASLFWLSPIAGLVLSICGVLPGTKRRPDAREEV